MMRFIRFLLRPFAWLFDLHARTHYRMERHSIALAIGIIAVASLGGLFEIAPLFTVRSTVESPDDMRVYTPLEQAGRDIYIREGCYACHSQMIRTLRDEVERYGPYSLAAESQYDHPHLWASKRTGPDLARLGGKYSDDWHVRHMINPRDVVPPSVMPQYAFLQDTELKVSDMPLRLAALRKVGVPYTEEQIANAALDARAQAMPDSDGADGVAERYGDDTNIRMFDGRPDMVTEMDAMVAYLQILGQLTQLAYETQPQPEE